MLDFRRDINQDVNNITVDDQDIFKDYELTNYDNNINSEDKTYGYEQWNADLNAASCQDIDFTNQDENIFDKFSPHVELFPDKTNEVSDKAYSASIAMQSDAISNDTNLKENSAVAVNADNTLEQNKKRTISPKTKVHIIIYVSLLTLVLSMIIANAWIMNSAQIAGGSAVLAESAETTINYDFSQGTEMHSSFKSSENKKAIVNTQKEDFVENNWFDKLCDRMDKK